MIRYGIMDGTNMEGTECKANVFTLTITMKHHVERNCLKRIVMKQFTAKKYD